VLCFKEEMINMGEVISVVSGKGGVGKTTLVANVSIALSELGFSVLMIDADITMSNLSLLIGINNPPITLTDVLLGSASVKDATYDGPKKTKIIPSSLSLSSFQKIDSDKLVSIVKDIKDQYDYVLIDSPAGIEKNVISSMVAATQILLITEPTSPSVADVFKIKIIAERLNLRMLGVIINKVSNIKGEIQEKDIVRMLELPCYGKIPYTEDIRESFLLQKIEPVIIHKPTSVSAEAFRAIARRISGKEVQVVQSKERKGIFSLFLKLFSKNKKIKR